MKEIKIQETADFFILSEGYIKKKIFWNIFRNLKEFQELGKSEDIEKSINLLIKLNQDDLMNEIANYVTDLILNINCRPECIDEINDFIRIQRNIRSK